MLIATVLLGLLTGLAFYPAVAVWVGRFIPHKSGGEVLAGSGGRPKACIVDGVPSATDSNNPGKLVASTAACSESVDVVVPVVEKTPRSSHR